MHLVLFGFQSSILAGNAMVQGPWEPAVESDFTDKKHESLETFDLPDIAGTAYCCLLRTQTSVTYLSSGHKSLSASLRRRRLL